MATKWERNPAGWMQVCICKCCLKQLSTSQSKAVFVEVIVLYLKGLESFSFWRRQNAFTVVLHYVTISRKILLVPNRPFLSLLFFFLKFWVEHKPNWRIVQTLWPMLPAVFRGFLFADSRVTVCIFARLSEKGTKKARRGRGWGVEVYRTSGVKTTTTNTYKKKLKFYGLILTWTRFANWWMSSAYLHFLYSTAILQVTQIITDSFRVFRSGWSHTFTTGFVWANATPPWTGLDPDCHYHHYWRAR